MCVGCMECVGVAVGAAAVAQQRFSIWQRLAAWWNRHTHRTQNPTRKHTGSTPVAATNSDAFASRCIGVLKNDCPAPFARCHQGCKYANDKGEPTLQEV